MKKIRMITFNTVIFIYSLLTHLIALIVFLSLFAFRCRFKVIIDKLDKVHVYCFSKHYHEHYWGVTLGMFTFINNIETSTNKDLMKHELGHSVQSLILGPLYLLYVGIPSLISCIVCRKDNDKYKSLDWEAYPDKVGKLIYPY